MKFTNSNNLGGVMKTTTAKKVEERQFEKYNLGVNGIEE